jgi:hypothetical protein
MYGERPESPRPEKWPRPLAHTPDVFEDAGTLEPYPVAVPDGDKTRTPREEIEGAEIVSFQGFLARPAGTPLATEDGRPYAREADQPDDELA